MVTTRKRYFAHCFFLSFILMGFLMPPSAMLCFAQGAVDEAGEERFNHPRWHKWQTVGYATFKWGFWEIYHAQLKTPSGLYQEGDPFATDMALLIDYRRDISKKSLLIATDKQWRHLGIAKEQRKRWIRELGNIWKGVRKGDRLVFVLTGSGGHFYFGNDLLGKTDDLLLARAFINIWLSEKSAYPELGRQLREKQTRGH